MDQKDLEQLKRLGELYAQAKLLILYSEEIDPTARSNIQVIKELRDALDHVMRVVNARLCDDTSSRANNDEYCAKNLEKAVGHVYRAAFDALDGTVLSLREKIVEVLKSYPLEVIKQVVPDYWDSRTKLEALTQNIAAHRAAKDVAGNVGETLDLYVRDTEQIKVLYKRIVDSGPSLDACHAAYKKEAGDEHKKHFKIHVSAGVVYTIIVATLGAVLGAFGCNPKNPPIVRGDSKEAHQPQGDAIGARAPNTSSDYQKK